MAGGWYHTGDVASLDADGYITYIGRTDDVFKASDFKISPFELESVLIEHPAVAEAAVVPAPDEVRLAVPKAYLMLAPGYAADAETAKSILALCARASAAVAAGPPDRVRRVAQDHLGQDPPGRATLPRGAGGGGEIKPSGTEWRDDMFPELKG
jgi:acetyl-CoA synthetase